MEDRIYSLSENLSAIATLLENGGVTEEEAKTMLDKQHSEMYNILMDMNSEVSGG